MKMREFMRLSNKGERCDVAEACDTSVPYLYQLAGCPRYASAYMALRLEEATRSVAERSDGRLAAVPRDSLVRHPEIFA